MKNIKFKITWLSLLLIAVSVFVTSCEQEALIPDDVLAAIEEENTADNINIVTEEETITATPLLHMRFKKGTTEEEMEAQWTAAVEEMETSVQSKLTIGWIFGITTLTGTGPVARTDGRVQARVKFDTDRGRINIGFFDLDNSGNDRESGQTDRYLFGVIRVNNNHPVRFVALREASISLQGRDEWFVEDFNVEVPDGTTPGQFDSLCGYPAVGKSTIYSNPNELLDNRLPHHWDTFKTGNVGSGAVFWPCH